MDIGEKFTEIENKIYDYAVSLLTKECVPPSLGRAVIETVYRRLYESAYNVALSRISEMEKKIAELEKPKEEVISE